MMISQPTRCLLVVCIGLIVGLPQGWSGPVSKHRGIVWVLDRLDEHPASSSPELAAWLDQLEQILPRLEARKFLGGFKEDIDVSSITVENPDYWRAVDLLEDDGIVLLWLHSLLLEQRKDVTEALGWAFFVRRIGLLSEDLDRRWISWETTLLKNSRMGQAYLVPPRSTSVAFTQQSVNDAQVSPTRGGGVYTQVAPVARLEPQYLGERYGYARRRNFPEPRLWSFLEEIAESEPTNAKLPQAVKILRAWWPKFPLFGSEELPVLSEWLELNGFPAEAMALTVMDRNSASEVNFDSMLRLLARLSDSEVPTDFFGSRSEDSAGARHFTFHPSKLASTGKRLIHPHLRADALQHLRRLDHLESASSWWDIPDTTFAIQKAQAYFLSGQVDLFQSILKKFPRSSRESVSLATLQIQGAIQRRDLESVNHWVGVLAELAQDSGERSIGLYVGSIYQSDWAEASRLFAIWCEEELAKENIERAGYFALHAHMTARMSGSENLTLVSKILAATSDESWIRDLLEASLGHITPRVLLDKIGNPEALEAAGRSCEAHAILAFLADEGSVERADHLRSSLASGRLDFIEYHIARFALRDTEQDR